MRFLSWRPAAVAIGALLAVTGSVQAGGTTPAGGSASKLNSAAAADTMTLGGKGTIESARLDYTELTRGGGHGGGFHGGGFHGGGFRGGFGGGFRGGVRVGVGFRGGFGGVRVGIGYGGYRGYGYRGYGYGGYGYGGYGYGGGYGGGLYSAYGYPYTSYGYGGYCGISATQADIYSPAVLLNAVAQVPVIHMPSTLVTQPIQVVSQPAQAGGDQTFPYDGGPARPIPQPLDSPRVAPGASVQPIPPSDDLRVVLKASALKDAKLAYTFKAYGEK